MVGICDGLNVLELGAGSIAASMTGVVLADAGARVVKIEPPEGDRLRAANPNGFRVWNRGKESVVADLRTPEGQERLRHLGGQADVVIEGFAPGVTDAWGIGPTHLVGANPRLVHCSITGFGRTGPYAKLKGYDPLVAAKAGLCGRGDWGFRDGPTMYPVPWGSFGAAMQASAGILGALLVREKSGRGQILDATLIGGLEPIDYFVATIVQIMAKQGATPSSDARNPMGASRYGVLAATKDNRYVQFSTVLPHQGRALSEVAGITDALQHPKFSRIPSFDSSEDAQEWEDMLLEAFRKEDLDHWLARLRDNYDIAFEVAVTSEEALDNPQFVHNGDVITIDDAEVGPIRQVGPIGHFSHTPCEITRSAPGLGENRGELAARSTPTGTQPAPAHLFAGVTIVEFGYFYAMPYAVAMAAALGARVIKIEDATGDPHRQSFGPEIASSKTTAGKESVSLDLGSAEGRRAALDIVERADVFITGFRTGVAEKLGLGYDDLRARNPSLLYVHAAGYGTDGPCARRALYAQAAQMAAGSFGRQVGAWADPARADGMSVMELQAVVLPRLNQVIDGDSNAALALLSALALGIYHQQRTNEGQLLCTSMIAGNAWAYSDDFCSYDGKLAVPICDDEYFGIGPMERLYQASEGWICLTVRTGEERRALAEALGERFAKKTAAEWETELSAAGIGCVEVNMTGHPVFMSYDPVLRETGLTVTVEHPVFGQLVRAAPPVRCSETQGRVAPACMRGQHNRDVLAELGYDDATIDQLEASGAVIPPTGTP